MITKFERKVIAGLMSIVLCLSMVFTVPVYAQEEEQAVVESEEVTGNDNLESDAGMIEETEGEEELQQPESDIPKEEQVVEEVPVPPMTEEQKEESGIQNAEVTAETETEVKEVITVSKDGTPKIVTTEGTGEDTYAKYQIQIEEDGMYYLELLKYTSLSWWFYEETENGERYTVEGDYGNALYQLCAGATYYLELTSNTDITWSVGKVQNYELGMQETVIQMEKQVVWYRFEVPVSGTYCCSYYGEPIYMRIVNEKTKEEQYVYGSHKFSFEKGESYFVQVGFNSMNETGTLKWEFSKLEEIEIQEGEVVKTNPEDAVYYKFVPEESGEYSVGRGIEIYDADWNRIYNYGKYNLESGLIYYMMLERDTTEYWSVKKEPLTEEVEVRDGGVYTQNPEEIVRYIFTPEESARYYFWSEEDAVLSIRDGKNGMGIASSYFEFGFYAFLEAGKQYEINLYDWGEQGQDITWHIEKASLQTATIGTSYTTERENSVEYTFVPETSGYYIITSNSQGYCNVYDNMWNPVKDSYAYSDDTGLSRTMLLNKGETYHIQVIAKNQPVVWKITLLQTNDEYVYRTLEDNTIEIVKYLGENKVIDVPSKIENKPVTSIGDGAFKGNQLLEAVTIPSKVTAIQYASFFNCANLQKIEFAKGSEIKEIGYQAFNRCEKLSECELPDTVQKISGHSFADCRSLKEIHLGEKLTEIGEGAFYGSGITSVSLPNSLKTIGKNTFGECSLLKQVVLGNGIDGIVDGMFSGCGSLEQITLPKNVTYIGCESFSGTGLKEIDIPETVTSVGEQAFAWCQSLEKAVIKNNMAYIAESAFANCGLKDITIGNQIETIGKYAFTNNENLETIVIPNSVTKIQYGAFYGCTNLLEIELPDSVKAIEGAAFDKTAWYENHSDGDVYAGRIYYKYKGEISENMLVTIKDGTKGIAGNAFLMQTKLNKVEMPESITNIGDCAFMGCESLKTITIPKTVTVIEEYALGYLNEKYKVPDFVIRGYEGTAAETYAKENGFTFESLGKVYIRGDVDGSEKVDVSDMRMVLRSITKKIELDETQKLAANVDGVDGVGIGDLRKILRYVCHKIDEL